jgi:hypothetical protein
MLYVEDQHGHVVSRESVIMMRSLAQNIWFELGITGAAAPSWEQVDVQSKKGYYRAMAASFFNLRLCDLDWKAEKIAQDNYPLWHLRWQMQNQGAEGSKRVRNASNVAPVRLKKSKAKRKESAVSTASNHFLRNALICYPISLETLLTKIVAKALCDEGSD